jgi:hypothetical protein
MVEELMVQNIHPGLLMMVSLLERKILKTRNRIYLFELHGLQNFLEIDCKDKTFTTHFQKQQEKFY